jgi:hypothetical protein
MQLLFKTGGQFIQFPARHAVTGKIDIPGRFGIVQSASKEDQACGAVISGQRCYFFELLTAESHGYRLRTRDALKYMTVSSYKQVSIKDLFEFAYLQAGGVKAEEIEKLLEGADEEKKRTIMKIIRAVVR